MPSYTATTMHTYLHRMHKRQKWWLPVIGPTATALAFLLARHATHGDTTWHTGTLARTMAQFALLMMMAVMPMMMLSGGMSPIESQPQWVQYVTWFFPSRHYVGFMQAIVYRGAGLDIVWKEFVTVLVMDVTFLVMSLLLFRQSVATLR